MCKLSNNKISVIVPVYNIEAYISQCIESIIGQTYLNLQIILVDDGSTDFSGKICDEYARQDDRIQVIHQKNKGLVSSRKAGLKMATGNFIGFVDGDDYVEPGFFETLLNFLLMDQVDFVHTGYIYEKNDISIRRYQFETGIYDLNNKTVAGIINEYVLGSGEERHITFSIWSKLYKSDLIKKCYDKIPPYLSMGEDLICLCLCLLEGKKVSFHKQALYHYNLRCDSLVNSTDATIILKMGKLYNCLLDIFDKYNITMQVEANLEAFIINTTFTSLVRSGKFCDFINVYIFSNVDLIRNKKIIIYGAGIVGQGYYAQLSKYTSCTITGWIDADYQNMHFDFADVIGIEEIQNLQYDFILIAVKNKDTADKIRTQIQEMGISDQKIVWEKPRALV